MANAGSTTNLHSRMRHRSAPSLANHRPGTLLHGFGGGGRAAVSSAGRWSEWGPRECLCLEDDVNSESRSPDSEPSGYASFRRWRWRPRGAESGGGGPKLGDLRRRGTGGEHDLRGGDGCVNLRLRGSGLRDRLRGAIELGPLRGPYGEGERTNVRLVYVAREFRAGEREREWVGMNLPEDEVRAGERDRDGWRANVRE